MTFHIGFLNKAQMDALHAAGHTIETAAITAGQHAVAIIKASPEGQQIVGMIHDVQGATGSAKFAAVLNDAIPLVEKVVADHGVSLIASVENTAREVIQSLFNDTVGKLA